MATREQQVAALQKDWDTNPRWKGVTHSYTADDVVRLRGSLQIEHTIAQRGADKMWDLLHTEPFVATLGALTGNQAMQQVKAGLKAIYLSGWQVAGDANVAGEMYPDQSLYPANSVPLVVKRINNTFQRADQIQWSEGKDDIDYFAPIVADAEAGFGGVLSAHEPMKAVMEGAPPGSISKTSSPPSRNAASRPGLHGCQASERSGHRLFRSGDPGHPAAELDDGPARIGRGRIVPRRGKSGVSTPPSGSEVRPPGRFGG